MSSSEAWYKDWFSSPYYNLLYKHRDEQEAARFLDNLVDFIQPTQQAKMLDVACGNGRHAIYLHQKGYDVTGIDLSEWQIRQAKKAEEEGLRFYVHDMREPFRHNHYNYIFNFFTSFGYFKEEKDNIKTLKAFHQSLQSGGCLILDFMNVKTAVQGMVKKETETIEDVKFELEREVTDHFIRKYITVYDGKEHHRFKEQVQRLTMEDFERYFQQTRFEIKNVFGDYSLNAFQRNQSPRLIFIAQKMN